ETSCPECADAAAAYNAAADRVRELEALSENLRGDNFSQALSAAQADAKAKADALRACEQRHCKQPPCSVGLHQHTNISGVDFWSTNPIEESSESGSGSGSGSSGSCSAGNNFTTFVGARTCSGCGLGAFAVNLSVSGDTVTITNFFGNGTQSFCGSDGRSFSRNLNLFGNPGHECQLFPFGGFFAVTCQEVAGPGNCAGSCN
ncbi:MAG: hypothetical protein ACREUA_09490, partial [Burkholderiales bacterium]